MRAERVEEPGTWSAQFQTRRLLLTLRFTWCCLVLEPIDVAAQDAVPMDDDDRIASGEEDSNPEAAGLSDHERVRRQAQREARRQTSKRERDDPQVESSNMVSTAVDNDEMDHVDLTQASPMTPIVRKVQAKRARRQRKSKR